MENIFGEKKLGFGLMRLPMLGNGDVDIETLKTMVDYFMEQGFTYFDTAWMYCGFKSEDAVKPAIVDRYPRDSFTITTKLHCGFFNTEEGMDEIFNKQLEKTGVEYFDYYLLHDLGEDHYKKYERLHSFEWIAKKKEAGLIKHMGFSYHDNAELLDRILTEHPEMEFVQLQLNYLDWDSIAIQSRACYEVCVKHNKPVIVMEPVKGGTLAKVPAEAEKMFKDQDASMSIPSWAIRFAASQPNVKMVLSGMGTMEMMEDNTSYMKEFAPLTEEEMQLCHKAADIINASIAIPCTGCSYCTDGCPVKIPIPKYFSLYNAEMQEVKEKGWTSQGEYYDRITMTAAPAGACIKCGRCEAICPQHLKIRDSLQLVAKQFGK